MPTHTHGCAICKRPIRHGLLMCALHWSLVPQQLQLDVYRTWGRMQRMGGAGLALKAQINNEYDAARDAAIASVSPATNPTAPNERGPA